MKRLVVMVMAVAALTACSRGMVEQRDYHTGPRTLSLSLQGSGWDGRRIPADQVCSQFGGQGSTPPIMVTGIPEDATHLLLEINNWNVDSLSYRGGLGAILIPHDGSPTRRLPPVRGETAELNAGAEIFRPTRPELFGINFSGEDHDDEIGYMPPCSGGQNHRYIAVVTAVKKPGVGTDITDLVTTGKPILYRMASGRIELGRF